MHRALLAAVFALSLMGQIKAPNGSGVSMGHLHLLSRDPAAHRLFWVDLLGGQPVTWGKMEVFKFPDVLVMVQKGEPSAGSEGSAINHLGFLVGNLEEYVAKAQAKGFQVAPQRPSPVQAFVFAPDGIKVELTEDKSISGGAAHHHVHWFTGSDVDTKAWYVRMFGGVPGRRGRFEAADIPGANLTFSKSEQPVSATKGRAVDHVGFEVTNLEAFVKKMEADGLKFDIPYRKLPSGLAIAFFTDPWGTYVELTEGLGKI
jgi:catechol 2,3-dioxygenase-like lactoylglutathione lyase family enzyme